MSKVITWRRKMNEYYNNITPEKLRHDLQESGFRVIPKSTEERMIEFQALNLGYAEVAARSELILYKSDLLEDESVDDAVKMGCSFP